MQITQTHLFFSRPEFSPYLLYESYDASTINDLHLSCIVMLLQAVSVCCGKDDVLRLQGTGPPSSHTACSLCWDREKSVGRICGTVWAFSYVEKRDIFGFSQQLDLCRHIAFYFFYIFFHGYSYPLNHFIPQVSTAGMIFPEISPLPQ